MVTRFRTETGSLYELDFAAKTWARVKEPLFVGPHPLRTLTDTFESVHPDPIRVGESVFIIGKPIDPRASFREIVTSHVVDIVVEGK